MKLLSSGEHRQMMGEVRVAVGSHGGNFYLVWVWWWVREKVVMVRKGQVFWRKWCLSHEMQDELELDEGKGLLCRRHSLCRAHVVFSKALGSVWLEQRLGSQGDWGGKEGEIGRGQVMPLIDDLWDACETFILVCILSWAIYLAPGGLEALSVLGTGCAQYTGKIPGSQCAHSQWGRQ